MPKTVFIDLRKYPMFTGYVILYSFRYFWFSYIAHLKHGFKNMKYGNILQSLLLPLTLLVTITKLVNHHIMVSLAQVHEMYNMLAES